MGLMVINPNTYSKYILFLMNQYDTTRHNTFICRSSQNIKLSLWIGVAAQRLVFLPDNGIRT